MRNLLLSILGSVALLSACSGRVATDSAGGGGKSGGSSGSVQCTAAPSCGSDEDTLALLGPQDPAIYQCPAGRECSVHELCGSFALCAKRVVACAAVPSCDVGDRPMPQNQACNPMDGDTCYARTVCGSTVYCAKSTKCNEPRCGLDDKEIGEIPDCKAGGCVPIAEPTCPEATTCYTRHSCDTTVYCSTTKE
jgi:hypothetical protein